MINIKHYLLNLTLFGQFGSFPYCLDSVGYIWICIYLDIFELSKLDIFGLSKLDIFGYIQDSITLAIAVGFGKFSSFHCCLSICCHPEKDAMVLLITPSCVEMGSWFWLLRLFFIFGFVDNTSCVEMGLTVLVNQVVFCSVYTASYIQYANEPI